jgi:SAM-dependent methyltransferase
MLQDEHNLMLVESPKQVDSMNAGFYNRFPYPWRPASFTYPEDPNIYAQLLNQNLGSYQRELVSTNGRIWVAGCGTNQAIYTALRFPQATILGSDLSRNSLSLCSETAKMLDIRNLDLRQENLNEVNYSSAFDYVICTGVIHHTAEPQRALHKLSIALKPRGILELMVYNRYHRQLHQAFQKAIRVLARSASEAVGHEAEIQLARKIVRALNVYDLADCPEAQLADSLIQPVEHSYTIESLRAMADLCALELWQPCPNEHDQAMSSLLWHVDFKDAEVQQEFDSLPDVRRWYVSNLLLMERSPMLWFYLQRKNSGRHRPSETEINQHFLDTIFRRIKSTQSCYLRDSVQGYSLSSRQIPFPTGKPHLLVRPIYDSVDGITPMRKIFDRLGLPTDLGFMASARLRLSSTIFPYISAIASLP